MPDETPRERRTLQRVLITLAVWMGLFGVFAWIGVRLAVATGHDPTTWLPAVPIGPVVIFIGLASILIGLGLRLRATRAEADAWDGPSQGSGR